MKPGADCKTAPRTSSRKLASSAWSKERDIKPTTRGPSSGAQHVGAADAQGIGTSGPTLAMTLSKHAGGLLPAAITRNSNNAGDLEIAGLKKYVGQLAAHVEQAFGMMTSDYDTFTICGVASCAAQTARRPWTRTSA